MSFLSWDEKASDNSSGGGGGNRPPSARHRQPAGGASSFSLSNDPVTENVRPSTMQSQAKQREMSGSNIFGDDSGPVSNSSSNKFANGNDQNNGNVITDRPTTRVNQHPGGRSQISFGDDSRRETPPKSRVGTEATPRPISAAKAREISGSNIVSGGSAPDEPAPARQSSNSFANGNDQNNGNFITDRPTTRVHQAPGGRSQIIFGNDDANAGSSEDPNAHLSKGRRAAVPGASERKNESVSLASNNNNNISPNIAEGSPLQAKVKEIVGNDIFKQDVGPPRSTLGGVRKPPGGGSSFAFG